MAVVSERRFGRTNYERVRNNDAGDERDVTIL